ncbi:MAG: menaquinone biosynthesis decarboxylase [Vampirovibrionales bacterium]|nr:menaquinone biosynthesis decarboxylase [Vampirovibrionales bacterium]
MKLTNPTQNKPPQDLRTFIEQLRAAGELIEITEPVRAHLEITEITDRVSKQQGASNKALLFTHVLDEAGRKYPMPVLINAMGSHQRTLMGLGVANYETVQKRIEALIKPDVLSGGGLFQKLGMLPKLAELNNIFPRQCSGKTAPCQEVVITDPSQAMLDSLPVLTCWPDDGGPYITMPIIIVREPGADGKQGPRNVGMYRMQKFDNATTGMHWQKHHDGNRIYENARRLGKDRVEVAVALGAPPHVIYAATAPLPPGIDELMLAGFIHNKPVEMTPCKTIDLDVPAHSEIILEGYVLLDELRREGPFGDHTGVYSLADDYPVFHITAMTHRQNPIYQTTIVGKPPQEDCYLGKATERIFLPLLKLFISEIVDMNLPWEGVFHNCVILSIDKRFPGHGKKVMSSLWGFGQLMFSKYVIVVDKHVDVQNLSEVAWHVFNHTDPKRDMMFADGPLDMLDHATPMPGYGSKVGIDATRKWESEGFTREWPEELVMSPEIQQQVSQKWGQLFGKSVQV